MLEMASRKRGLNVREVVELIGLVVRQANSEIIRADVTSDAECLPGPTFA